MHSTLTPKQPDDPHDILVVAPDDVRVAPADEELSNLLHEAAARHRSDPQIGAQSGLPAAPPVPPVDTTFRPAAVNNVRAPGHRWSMSRGAVRALTALLVAVCISVAAFAWQSSGNVAKQIIARWAPNLVLTSLLSGEKPGPAVQPAVPAVQANAANAAPPQPAPPAQSAAGAVAPAAALSPDSAQLLQSMARDLASAGQEIEQLKASIEQLKASQQQMSRDVARVSEPNPRPRISAPPPRQAVARAHKPMPPYPPPTQAAAAPTLQQTAAPSYVPRQPDYVQRQPDYVARQPDYVPRQPEPQPQATVEPQAEPELSPIPRPPMPVR